MEEYVYIVTAVNGNFEKQVEVGQKIIDKKYFGKEHTWQSIDLKTGEVNGMITGKYDGKGITLKTQDQKF